MIVTRYSCLIIVLIKKRSGITCPFLSYLAYLILLIKSLILMPTSFLPAKPVPGFIAL